MKFISRLNLRNLPSRPAGALTSKRYAFGERVWELDFVDSFDPDQELYFPVKLGIKDFQLRRVFSINKAIGSQYSYNWIPDRTRHLFRSFNVSIPDVNLKPSNFDLHRITCSWFYILTVVSRLGVFSRKIVSESYSNAYDSISIGSVSRYVNHYNVISQFRIGNSTDISYQLNVPKIVEYSNYGLGKLFSIINPNFNDLKTFEQGPISVFLLGFNPYFFDPLLNYRLKVSSELGYISIRSFFIQGSPLNFRYLNNSIGVEALKRFLYGRHIDSFYIGPSATLLIDPSILKYFDFYFWSIFYNFLFLNSFASIYLIGFKEFNLAEFLNYVSLHYINNFTSLNTNCDYWFKRVSWQFQNGHPSLRNFDKPKNFNYTKLSTYPVLGNKSFSSFFKDDHILFSSTSNLHSEDGNIYLPVSSFINFESSLRGNFFTRAQRFSRIGHSYNTSGRFLGSIFSILYLRSFDFTNYNYRGLSVVSRLISTYGLVLLVYFLFGCIFSTNFVWKIENLLKNGIRTFGFSDFRSYRYRFSNYTVYNYINNDSFYPTIYPVNFISPKIQANNYYRPKYVVSGLVGYSNYNIFSDFGSRFMFNFLNFKKLNQVTG